MNPVKKRLLPRAKTLNDWLLTRSEAYKIELDALGRAVELYKGSGDPSPIRQMIPASVPWTTVYSSLRRLRVRPQNSTPVPSLPGEAREASTILAEYQKLLDREHQLENDLADVKRKLETYKPVASAVRVLQDAVRKVKGENP